MSNILLPKGQVMFIWIEWLELMNKCMWVPSFLKLYLDDSFVCVGECVLDPVWHRVCKLGESQGQDRRIQG